MAGSFVLANSKVYSGNAATSGTTLTFPWRSRRLIITNDSGAYSLNVEMKAGNGESIELKPDETLNIDDFWTTSISLISGDASQTCPYRVWVFG